METLLKSDVEPTLNSTPVPQRRPRFNHRFFGGKDGAAFTAHTVKSLAPEDMGKGIMRVHNRRIDRTRSDPAKFIRRETVKIVNGENPKLWILAQVVGAGHGVKGLEMDTICLDYDNRDALGLREVDHVNLKVQRASEWDIWRAGWDSPNPLERLNTRLGLLGFVLGVLGLLTAFV